ncbi:proteasome endopeptidase complex, archaeal, beta subunit [Caldisphaera lagunensis DSM 15908]|uniref:Proteasome subunit beta n=1 Tax=Caldisphaera lagunensis (strain DSM 15908 / JCM 11604 / ANMR 0165 / IC-154) TaxID=1056495 RepID=L0A8S6_CALLD|nr:archaeal proteasome endopeptidase complex subunit beta [Caldisphaera lagunensis]AFZ70278.1 proteasome endopeptidase complex, archaeal, beta subunit [Caldisphaera lagunensis DSM 15908]
MAISYEQGTALGIKAKDGVVLATDKRMSYGSFIMSRNAKKVYLLNDRVGIALTGLYADVSGLVRIMNAEISYYETTNETTMSLYAISKLFSNILYSYKMLPFLIESIIGGLDRDGKPKIYTLDALGSVTEDKYMAVGSGGTTALGVLEYSYNDNLTIDEAEKIAITALKTTMERDSSSGDGIDLLIIKSEGKPLEKSYKLKVVEEGQ